MASETERLPGEPFPSLVQLGLADRFRIVGQVDGVRWSEAVSLGGISVGEEYYARTVLFDRRDDSGKPVGEGLAAFLWKRQQNVIVPLGYTCLNKHRVYPRWGVCGFVNFLPLYNLEDVYRYPDDLRVCLEKQAREPTGPGMRMFGARGGHLGWILWAVASGVAELGGMDDIVIDRDQTGKVFRGEELSYYDRCRLFFDELDSRAIDRKRAMTAPPGFEGVKTVRSRLTQKQEMILAKAFGLIRQDISYRDWVLRLEDGHLPHDVSTPQG